MKKIFTLIMILSVVVSANAAISEISRKEELDKVLADHEKVVAEFYSPSCPHCISFNKSGIFESLAKEFKDVAFVKINYNTSKPLFAQFSVRAFPTFIIFKDQKASNTHVGSITKEKLKVLIQNK